MSELLQQVTTELQNRQQEREADYRALVASVAMGQANDPAQVAEQLNALNKTPAQFAGDVNYYAERLEICKRLDSRPQLTAELAAHKEKWEAEMARWRKLEKAHNEIAAPLAAAIESLEQQITWLGYESQGLRKTYRGPLIAELAECHAQGGQLRQELGRLQEEKRHVRAHTHGLHRRFYPPSDPEQVLCEQKCNAIDGQIAEIESRLKGLNRAAAQIEAGMYRP